MTPTELAYYCVLHFIRIYKWLELQVFRLFESHVNYVATRKFRRIGVIFHFPGDPPWTNKHEQEALLRSKYKKLLHFKVNRREFFVHLANQGSLALGEMFMDGIYEPLGSDNDLPQMVRRFVEGNLWQELYAHRWNRFLMYLELEAFNLQTKTRAFEVGRKHYDLGNDLYESFLDPQMQYTCAYWARADNLNDAQLHKLELIAKKLDLKPGMRVLDMGCGWGTLCKYLAEHHGVSCVGVTVGKEGADYGNRVCAHLPVEIRVQDYRDVNEKFDRIVSIGLMEHVGFRNYRSFLEVVRKNLKDDGVFLLHTIGSNHKNTPRTEPLHHKYIFPNGMVPYHTEVAEAVDGLFVIEDWHNFGPDYATTLEAWRENFKRSWPSLKDKYGDWFYRMWIMYLAFAEGLFLSRRFQLWQLVLSKEGLQREYRAAR